MNSEISSSVSELISALANALNTTVAGVKEQLPDLIHAYIVGKAIEDMANALYYFLVPIFLVLGISGFVAYINSYHDDFEKILNPKAYKFGKYSMKWSLRLLITIPFITILSKVLILIFAPEYIIIRDIIKMIGG